MTIDFLNIHRSSPHADEGGQTFDDDTITIRDRDTTQQTRVKTNNINKELSR